MFFIIFFLLGCIWGSFANVCINRIPLNKSVIFARSLCPNCKKTIKWFNNIPLISYLLLNAKCRDCNKKISSEYFIVELTSAIAFTIVYYFYGISITSLLLLILIIFFIIIFFIDLNHYIIPNELTYPLMVIGFVKSFDPNINSFLFPNYINSLIGGVFGYLIIWLIIFAYKKIKNKEGMGLGDAKLLSAIGFWFGWTSIPFILFFSSVIALISTLPSLIKKTKNLSSQIPFGPYIVLGITMHIILRHIV